MLSRVPLKKGLGFWSCCGHWVGRHIGWVPVHPFESCRWLAEWTEQDNVQGPWMGMHQLLWTLLMTMPHQSHHQKNAGVSCTFMHRENFILCPAILNFLNLICEKQSDFGCVVCQCQMMAQSVQILSKICRSPTTSCHECSPWSHAPIGVWLSRQQSKFHIQSASSVESLCSFCHHDAMSTQMASHSDGQLLLSLDEPIGLILACCVEHMTLQIFIAAFKLWWRWRPIKTPVVASRSSPCISTSSTSGLTAACGVSFAHGDVNPQRSLPRWLDCPVSDCNMLNLLSKPGPSACPLWQARFLLVC